MSDIFQRDAHLIPFQRNFISRNFTFFHQCDYTITELFSLSHIKKNMFKSIRIRPKYNIGQLNPNVHRIALLPKSNSTLKNFISASPMSQPTPLPPEASSDNDTHACVWPPLMLVRPPRSHLLKSTDTATLQKPPFGRTWEARKKSKSDCRKSSPFHQLTPPGSLYPPILRLLGHPANNVNSM